MAGTALLTVSHYLAAGTADEPDLPARSGAGHPPPFRSADGVIFELETLYPEPWRLLWTSLGVPEGVAGRAWRPFMLRYTRAVAPLPAALHAATQTRPFTELTRAATAAGVAVQRLRRHTEVSRAAAPGSGEGPLAGMVVVEAGRRVLGPLAGHLLGLLGAEVIRMVEADLWNPAGRRTVLDAVAQADVFLHNWAPGKAAQLGLDHDHLAAINPRLVSAHASGWGDALGAHSPPGTDFMVQAYAGLPERLTPVGEAPAGSLMTLLGVLGGLVVTSGVLAGLLGREQDGRGRRVRSSLLSAAALLQAQLGEREPNEPPELGAFGVPLPAVDGDLVLSRTASPRTVTAALGVSNLTEVPATIAAQPVDRSLALLTAAGVDAVRACHDPRELAGDLWAATLIHQDRCALVRPPWTFTA
jgi:CoA:oxalate CoA-transferase